MHALHAGLHLCCFWVGCTLSCHHALLCVLLQGEEAGPEDPSAVCFFSVHLCRFALNPTLVVPHFLIAAGRGGGA